MPHAGGAFEGLASSGFSSSLFSPPSFGGGSSGFLPTTTAGAPLGGFRPSLGTSTGFRPTTVSGGSGSGGGFFSNLGTSFTNSFLRPLATFGGNVAGAGLSILAQSGLQKLADISGSPVVGRGPGPGPLGQPGSALGPLLQLLQGGRTVRPGTVVMPTGSVPGPGQAQLPSLGTGFQSLLSGLNQAGQQLVGSGIFGGGGPVGAAPGFGTAGISSLIRSPGLRNLLLGAGGAGAVELLAGGGGGAANLGQPFRATLGGARAQKFMVANPVTGTATWFGPLGKPILFTGDFQAAKRVQRVARRAKRRSPR